METPPPPQNPIPQSPTPPPVSDTVTMSRSWAYFLVGAVILGGFALFALLTSTVVNAAKMPPMPISVTWREALLDKTQVCKIKLTVIQKGAFRLKVTHFNRTTNLLFSDTVTLGGNSGEDEIGHLEGFKLLAGDTLEFTHPDYQTIKVTVP